MSRPTHGLRDWLLQRLTAVYLAIFLGYLLVHFLLQPEHTYQQWHDWVTQPVMVIAISLFIVAVLIHGWVGMRDVILDYVHSVSLRLTILSLVALTLAACGIRALHVLIQATQ